MNFFSDWFKTASPPASSSSANNAAAIPPGRSTETQSLRMKQINTLLQYLPQTRVLQHDAKYEIPIRGQPISLIIVLPATFPQTSPVVQVSPSVRHPWIDRFSQVVGNPKLTTQWDAHTVLGKAVKEVVDEFESNPPNPLGAGTSLPPTTTTTMGTTVATAATAAAAVPGSSGSYPRPALPQQQPPQQQGQYQSGVGVYRTGKSVDFLPHLRDIKSEELNYLIQNDASIDHFLESLDLLPSVPANNASVIPDTSANRELEMKESKLRGELDDRKVILSIYQKESDDLKRDVLETQKRFSAPELLRHMEEGKSQLNQDCESIANDYLSATGSKTTDQFLEGYLAKRQLYHKRESIGKYASQNLHLLTYGPLRNLASNNTTL